jgi:hypothetical protein
MIYSGAHYYRFGVGAELGLSKGEPEGSWKGAEGEQSGTR